jgi:hypothetical protein
MKNNAMVTVMLLGACAMAFSYPSAAQNAVGGATKTKQSTLGGAAKPGPVIGGATTQSPVGGAPKQNPIGGTAKQSSIGSAITQGTTGGAVRQNPPVVPPNKGGPVVTSNLKCATGACVAKGTKP